MENTNEFTGAYFIADLSGYTALTEAHGDFSATQIISRYNEIVSGVLTKDVKFYQQVGDEIFLISSYSHSLLDYSIKLRNEIEKETHFPSIHGGLHNGTVIRQKEKIFGSAINLTSRIASFAQGGQILTSKSFKDSITESEVSFHSMGEIMFKNIIKPVEIFEIKTSENSEEILYTDPVCQMHISATGAPAKLPFKNNTIYFCSFECAKKFIIHPELYLKANHD
jgi:class 3 adenylate cyclase/YHS domain-containing protein